MDAAWARHAVCESAFKGLSRPIWALHYLCVDVLYIQQNTTDIQRNYQILQWNG